jgi:Flp pilus assembly protein TadD
MHMRASKTATLRLTASVFALSSCFFSISWEAYAFNPQDGALDMQGSFQVASTSATPLYNSGSARPSVPTYVSPLTPLEMPDKPLYPSRTGVAPAAQPIAAAPVMMAPILPPVDPAVQAKAQAIIAAQQPAPAPIQAPAIAPAPVVAAQTAEPATPGFIAPAPVLMAMAEPVQPNTETPVTAPAPVLAEAPKAAPIIAPAPVLAMAEPAKPIIAAPAPVVAAPLAAPVIAPAPVLAEAPVPPAPVLAPAPAVTYFPANKAPVVVEPEVAIAPQPIMPPAGPELSDNSRKILSHVPSGMDTPVRTKTAQVKLERVSPEIQEILGNKAQEESYEAVGLSIKVRRPGLDANYELNRAYSALMGGDTQSAIATYKNILSVDPRNEEALFGLAATYHRLGMTEQARPLYGMLLQVDPNHREGLNNFLVLVSDESPQDALPELERLEARNPDFSPIPAQIAIVLDGLGYPEQARDKMLRAIELAPDNLSYKYNLAVMLDRQGQTADAAALYKSLIQASLHGADVPASTDVMQKRLNYLVGQMTSQRTAMQQN